MDIAVFWKNHFRKSAKTAAAVFLECIAQTHLDFKVKIWKTAKPQMRGGLTKPTTPPAKDENKVKLMKNRKTADICHFHEVNLRFF